MYRLVCIGFAIASLSLCLLLMLNGHLYVRTYGISPDTGADFMARRAAPMFAGFAILLWLGRDLAVGQGRDMVCYSVALALCGIAATGVYEFMTGTADWRILIAAGLEIAVGSLFLFVRTGQIHTE